MEEVIVIPARMGSSRFPGKPLAPILSVPMLGWVISHAVAAVGKENTVVASCDAEILEYAESLSVRAVSTSSSHERASDRTAEAVATLEAEGWPIQRVLMLQGDEPTISADALTSVFSALRGDLEIEIVNLSGPINNATESLDPNSIKVVARQDGTALYFSRLPIPHGGDPEQGSHRKQVCAIGFQRPALGAFSAMPEGALERAESIDMLRWLENGRNVHLVEIFDVTHPVDVLEDIAVVESLLAGTSAP